MPFLDIIMNVLLFVLATMPAVFTATALVEPPSTPRPGTRQPEHPTLRLTALVTGEGVSLKTGAFSIGPGCEAGGSGFTVAARDGVIDWGEVKACARKLKDASPDYANESDVTLTASSGVPYAQVIQAMDALRQDERGVLFPEVSFGVIR